MTHFNNLPGSPEHKTVSWSYCGDSMEYNIGARKSDSQDGFVNHINITQSYLPGISGEEILTKY
jgi:hypothetical protein